MNAQCECYMRSFRGIKRTQLSIANLKQNDDRRLQIYVNGRQNVYICIRQDVGTAVSKLPNATLRNVRI